MPDRAAGPAPSKPTAAGGADGGFSLVELMVAMLILGVVLSAMASALINFSVTSVTNERRVQATALLTQLHEQLQSIPWDRAFIYEDEASALAEIGLDTSVDPWRLDGERLVVEPGPEECDPADDDPDCGRRSFVPKATDKVEVGDRDYEVFQAVTWDPTIGDGFAVKRFTTMVRWEVRGEYIEQTFESTRAATMAEIGDSDLPDVLSLMVAPGIVELDDDGRNLSDITVRVVFSRGMLGSELSYPAIMADGEGPTPQKMSMVPTDVDEDSVPYAFEATIDASSEVFLPAEQDLEVKGTDAAGDVFASRTVQFVLASDGPPAPSIRPTSVSVSRTQVEVGTNGQADGKLCHALTIRVRVDNVAGGETPGTVTANYLDRTGAGASMPPLTTITGSNDEFVYTFPRGSISPWKPTPATQGGGGTTAQDVTDRFDIVAANPDGKESSLVTSEQMTFRSKTSGGSC